MYATVNKLYTKDVYIIYKAIYSFQVCTVDYEK